MASVFTSRLHHARVTICTTALCWLQRGNYSVFLVGQFKSERFELSSGPNQFPNIFSKLEFFSFYFFFLKKRDLFFKNWVTQLWRLASPKCRVYCQARDPRKSNLSPKAICWQNSHLLGGGQVLWSMQTFN